MKILACASALLFLFSCRQTTETPPSTATAPSSTALPSTVQPSPVPPSPPPADSVACTPAPNRLCPVDEGDRDASFRSYRDALMDAVKRKDEAKLRELVDPAIRTSFGDSGGIEDFMKRGLWSELETILGMGGRFLGEGDAAFWAPYVYAAWPENLDAFQHVAALRAGIPIRSEPRSDANVVATVDWAILELVGSGGENEGWRRLREGWVERKDVRSPIDYRAGFNKREGRWRMTALVAGD